MIDLFLLVALVLAGLAFLLVGKYFRDATIFIFGSFWFFVSGLYWLVELGDIWINFVFSILLIGFGIYTVFLGTDKFIWGKNDERR